MLDEDLARLAFSFSYADLEPSGVDQATRILVDTMGCFLGGLNSRPMNIVASLAKNVNSSSPATVPWTGVRTSADMAAFANGVAIRYLDFNDTYTNREVGHPSDQIGALLPIAEIAHADGRRLLEAIALSYELFGRLADSVNIRHRGFDYVTLQCISTALAVGKLMGLTREQLTEAARLATVANGALFQTRVGDVSLWKACAAANAGRNAVVAAELAQAGMTGPRQVFEGRAGFFHAISGTSFSIDSEPRRADALKVFAVDMKRFPFGHLSQTAIDAALKLRSSIADRRDIVAIEVGTFQPAIDIMAGDPEKWRPRNRETADHSMPFAIALAVIYGRIELEMFDIEYLDAPEVTELLPKITISATAASNNAWPEAMLTTLRARTSTGEQFEAESKFHRGHRSNPMNDPELDQKFSMLAERELGRAEAEHVLHELRNIRECHDVHTFLQDVCSAPTVPGGVA